MQTLLNTIDTELNRLVLEEQNLQRSIDKNQSSIRRLLIYKSTLLTYGKEYADFSKLIYANFSYSHSADEPHVATEKNTVLFHIEATGQLEQVYLYTITIDPAENNQATPHFTCRLEDILRFYGRSIKLGFNPTVIIAKYFENDTDYKFGNDHLFRELGRLLDSPDYVPAFDYFTTGAPLLENCHVCSKLTPVSTQTADVLNKISRSYGLAEILCSCVEAWDDRGACPKT